MNEYDNVLDVLIQSRNVWIFVALKNLTEDWQDSHSLSGHENYLYKAGFAERKSETGGMRPGGCSILYKLTFSGLQLKKLLGL
jgi:hypothetical protein